MAYGVSSRTSYLDPLSCKKWLCCVCARDAARPSSLTLRTRQVD